MMELLPWKLTEEEEEEEYETHKEREEYILERIFERRKVEFQFVRGSTEVIEYDKFDGKKKNVRGPRISNGSRISTRGDVRVERFFTVERGNSAYAGGHGDVLRLFGEPTGDEVTIANVTTRKTIDTTEMVARRPVYRVVTIRDDTGEEVSRGRVPRRQDGVECTIEEYDGEYNDDVRVRASGHVR